MQLSGGLVDLAGNERFGVGRSPLPIGVKFRILTRSPRSGLVLENLLNHGANLLSCSRYKVIFRRLESYPKLVHPCSHARRRSIELLHRAEAR